MYEPVPAFGNDRELSHLSGNTGSLSVTVLTTLYSVTWIHLENLSLRCISVPLASAADRLGGTASPLPFLLPTT